jgi:hypothetical protein
MTVPAPEAVKPRFKNVLHVELDKFKPLIPLQKIPPYDRAGIQHTSLHDKWNLMITIGFPLNHFAVKTWLQTQPIFGPPEQGREQGQFEPSTRAYRE